MKKAIWISPLLAIALLTAGCTEKTRTTESTGELRSSSVNGSITESGLG